MRTKTAKAKAQKLAAANLTSGVPSNAVVGTATEENGKPICQDDIRLRAYQKWEGAGKPIGDETEFWLEAERELLSGMAHRR